MDCLNGDLRIAGLLRLPQGSQSNISDRHKENCMASYNPDHQFHLIVLFK